MSSNSDTIIRAADHSEKDLQICRKTIRDPKLDLQGKGLLIFLLDKPNDWRIRPDALAKELGMGVATIYRIINRLIKVGYVHREILKREKDGTFSTGCIYIVFEDREYRREWADQQQFKGKRKYADIPF